MKTAQAAIIGRTFRVVTFTYLNGKIEFDGPGINKPSVQEAVEAWKEDACQQAELAFPGDMEAVDRNQLEVYDMKADLLSGIISHSEFFDNYAALVEDFNNSVPYLCYDIEWDTDGATDVGYLPTMVVIHATLEEGEEALSDALSDNYGFCHKGFKSEVIN